MRPRDLNSPLPSGRIVDAAGMPTLQFQNFIQRLWQRTGYAPGQDVTWLATLLDEAVLSGAAASTSALLAQSEANQARLLALMKGQADIIARQRDALDAAMLALAQSQRRESAAREALDTAALALSQALLAESKASKALEMAADSGIFSFTARR